MGTFTVACMYVAVTGNHFENYPDRHNKCEPVNPLNSKLIYGMTKNDAASIISSCTTECTNNRNISFTDDAIMVRGLAFNQDLGHGQC
jgi:hypothetical protein